MNARTRNIVVRFTGLFLGLGLAVISSRLVAADKLVVISPHRKSIEREFVPTFKEYYKAKYGTEVEVDWLDQGGTSDDVKFIRSKFKSTPQGIGVDVFWGGGSVPYIELAKEGLFEPLKLTDSQKTQIPDTIAGVPMHDNKTWVATAVSSFGIFFNRKVMALNKLPEPKTWADLADKMYFDQLSVTDPRKSGSAASMNTIIVQSQGWDQGYKTLALISGNTRKFTLSSSDPIKAVETGDAAAALVIDFYALAKMYELGQDKVGFNLPAEQNVLDPDPIAILKGAANKKVAERFVEYLLTPEAQSLLILPQGARGGPKFAALGRMAVNKKSYDDNIKAITIDINPFKQKPFMNFNADKAATMKMAFNDFFGAVFVDTHKELKAAWKVVIDRGMKADEVAALTKPTITEAELLKAAEKWDDAVVRNQMINTWTTAARGTYAKLAK